MESVIEMMIFKNAPGYEIGVYIFKHFIDFSHFFNHQFNGYWSNGWNRKPGFSPGIGKTPLETRRELRYKKVKMYQMSNAKKGLFQRILKRFRNESPTRKNQDPVKTPSEHLIIYSWGKKQGQRNMSSLRMPPEQNN